MEERRGKQEDGAPTPLSEPILMLLSLSMCDTKYVSMNETITHPEHNKNGIIHGKHSKGEELYGWQKRGESYHNTINIMCFFLNGGQPGKQ